MFHRSILADNAKSLPSILLGAMQIIHRFSKDFKEKIAIINLTFTIKYVIIYIVSTTFANKI